MTMTVAPPIDLTTSTTATDATTSRTMWSRRTSFWLVIGAQVLLLGASNFPTPLFPVYERQYHFGSAMVTLLFSSYIFALIPSMLTLGRVTDRVGRRPALVAGVAITVLSSIAFAFARNVGWLFAGEIIYGIAAGLVMSASTVTIRELHPKQHAGSGALTAMAAAAAGLSLGPLVSGVLASVTPWPTVSPFVLDIVLASALAVALLRIPETRPDVPAPATRPPALHVPASIRRQWIATTLASATVWMFMGWILGLSPSFLHEQLGVHVTQPVVAGLFAGVVVAFSGATQLLMRRHHHRVVSLRAGMGLILAGFAVFAASPHLGGLPVAVIGGLIAGIGGGLVQPNTMGTIQRIAPDHARGGVTSAFLAASYTAMSIPVVTAGLVASGAHVSLATISVFYVSVLALLVAIALVASRSTDQRSIR